MVALPKGPLPEPPEIPALPGGNVIPFPSNPLDTVDLNPGEAIAEVFKLGAAEELPATIAVSDIAIPLLVGAKVETALLENQHWDNFWIGVGGKLDDIWHGAAGFLFGSHGVSITTINEMIQLSSAQSRRFTRQLYTKITAYAAASQATTAKAFKAVATALSALDTKIGNVGKILTVEITNAIHTAESYTDRKVAALETKLNARILSTAQAVEQWAATNIGAPLVKEIGKVESELHSLEAGLGSIIDARVHAIVDSPITHLLGAVGAAQLALRVLETEAEDCTEPMCETMGPKTDLGKLLKSLSLASDAALLAELAALNEDGVTKLLRGLSGLANGVIDAFREDFLGGGASVADTVVGVVEHLA